jgi:ankyrin repeat protein
MLPSGKRPRSQDGSASAGGGVQPSSIADDGFRDVKRQRVLSPTMDTAGWNDDDSRRADTFAQVVRLCAYNGYARDVFKAGYSCISAYNDGELWRQFSRTKPYVGPFKRSLLMLAAAAGAADRTRWLMERGFWGSIEKRDVTDQTALHLAVAKRRTAAVGALLAFGADADGQSLTIAASNNDEKIALMLIKADADVNHADKRFRSNGFTSLCYAAKYNNVRLLEALRSKNAYLNLHSRDGRAPIHIAAEHGSLEAAKCLCLLGASVNVGTYGTSAPLVIAFRKGFTDIVRTLLVFGAGNKDAIRICEEDYETERYPVTCATAYLLEIARPALVLPMSVVQRAIYYEASSELLRTLVTKGGPEAGRAYSLGQTPMHVALSFGARGFPALEVMLEHRVDPEEKDASGKTPLEVAMLSGALSITDVYGLLEIFGQWDEGPSEHELEEADAANEAMEYLDPHECALVTPDELADQPDDYRDVAFIEASEQDNDEQGGYYDYPEGDDFCEDNSVQEQTVEAEDEDEVEDETGFSWWWCDTCDTFHRPKRPASSMTTARKATLMTTAQKTRKRCKTT